METLKALGSFVLGIIKRAYYWVPPMFLDPFDLYKLYIRPMLPSGAPENIVMPSELALWLFLALLLWAGFITYRELYVKYERVTRGIPDITPFVRLVEQAAGLRIIKAGRSTPDIDNVCQEAVIWTMAALSKISDRLGKTAYAQVCSKAELPFDRAIVSGDFGAQLAYCGFPDDDHGLGLIRSRHYTVLEWLKAFIASQPPTPGMAGHSNQVTS